MSTDPYLALPLDGLRLIEASAGTGKTFTLATLFTRLVIERHLALPQILAVTFTEAATQELRARIRERLALALEITTCPAMETDNPEILLTRTIVEQHLAHGGEAIAHLTARLGRAVEDADLASIFTIHGFCARVLGEYALESGQPLLQREFVTNPRDLHADLAADLWRTYSSQYEDSNVLARLWKDQQALAGDITVLASDLPLRPEIPQTLVPNPHHIVETATRHLAQSIAEHGQTARKLIADALADKTLNAQKAKPQSFNKAFIELNAGIALGQWPRGRNLHIDKLAANRLADLCNKGRIPPHSPLFDALQQWFEADELTQQWLEQQKIILLHRLRTEIKLRLAQTKRQRQIQSYDDLIDNLANALQGEQAEILAERLRAQYRFALVDEFQDTDPRQWEIFRTIFAPPSHKMGGGAAGLFLIGDPKQAIYGFRGGDIHTYLNARSSAIPAPPLNHNFRARPCVLRAIEILYNNAAHAAFGTAEIEFIPILPGGQSSDEDCLLDGQPAPALTVCKIASDGVQMAAEAARSAITTACVADIHRVLSASREGRMLIGGIPVQPGDIAVLVRNHKEATRIRTALAAVGIPAVAAGKQSIFATEQAHEIRLLLLALLNPSDPGRLRAVLATVLLGEDATSIAALDSGPGNPHYESLLHWHQIWLRSGIFAMLSEICAAHASRLLTLTDGERRLTNTLQLGEILQQESHRHPGLHGLVDWLHTRIAHADDHDDAQQLRLESDARCIQIVTLHKSKGLEYPLVYLPFVGMENASSKRSTYRVIHDGSQRVLYWSIHPGDEGWISAVKQTAQEDRNETARLMYVGLTRAKHALWIARGEWKGWQDSPLSAMLQDHHALSAHPGIIMTCANLELPSRFPSLLAPEIPRPRPRRRIQADWWVYSFTQLAHAEGHDDPAAAAAGGPQPGGADDEREMPWGQGWDSIVRCTGR